MTLLQPSAATPLALVLAFLLDAAFGEPPNALHPVAWVGRLATALLKLAPGSGTTRQFLFGAALTLGLAGSCAAISNALLHVSARWPVLQLSLSVLLLKSTFAVRALGEARLPVRDALQANDLPRARHALRSLCSRDASVLDAGQVTAGCIESLAENASDSFVAPLCWYLAAGLPGAVAYRVVNTLDAMIGYRGRYEYLGKFAARLDDLLNLVPARLCAWLLLTAAAVTGTPAADVKRAHAIRRRDARRTESPNAGYPMATMAGLLGVTLEKPGHYQLGDATRPIAVRDLDACWKIVHASAWLSAAISGGLAWTWTWSTHG